MSQIEPMTRKVLVINFRPAAVPPPATDAQGVHWWSHAEDLIPQYSQAMQKASGNHLAYQVVKKLDVSTYPVLLGDHQYDDVTWAQACADDTKAYRDQNHNYLMADYRRLIQDYGLGQVVQSQQADEVWMFGGPYFGFYESCMVGRGAFWCNSPAIELDCPRFVMMGFNYQREVREMVHDYGHRAESILDKHFGSEAFLSKLYQLQPVPAPANAYEQFLLKYGTVHREPGGEEYKQNEAAWLAALNPEWWPVTIDPKLVKPGWYRFLLNILSIFSPKK